MWRSAQRCPSRNQHGDCAAVYDRSTLCNAVDERAAVVPRSVGALAKVETEVSVSCFVDREPRIEQVIHGLLELVHVEPSSLFDREYELSAGVPAGCALMRLSCIHERI
jgi:hypothetical protein